jgi:hypothetical protein
MELIERCVEGRNQGLEEGAQQTKRKAGRNLRKSDAPVKLLQNVI